MLSYFGYILIAVVGLRKQFSFYERFRKDDEGGNWNWKLENERGVEKHIYLSFLKEWSESRFWVYRAQKDLFVYNILWKFSTKNILKSITYQC